MVSLLSSNGDGGAVRNASATVAACYTLSFIAATIFLPFVLRFASNPARAAVAAVLYVLLVTGAVEWTGRITLGVLRLDPETREEFLPTILSIGPWLVPILILCIDRNALALVVAGGFSVATAMFVRRFGAPGRDAEAFRYSRLTALVLFVYCGVLIEITGNTALAVLCVATGCFHLAWMEECQLRAGGRRIHRVVASLALAILVTFLGLLPVAGMRGGVAGSVAEGDQSRTKSGAPSRLQSGIILWTKHPPRVPLEIRRKQAQTKSLFSTAFSIPFSGEYWFFEWPLTRPPASAVRQEGQPSDVDITLEAFGTLMMEARQKIGRKLDIGCCQSINVVLSGTERQPATVLMELMLIDSTAKEHTSQSLGALPLGSAKFQYFIPSNSTVRSFDELAVWFHLQPPRSQKSASISIDRFDFIP